MLASTKRSRRFILPMAGLLATPALAQPEIHGFVESALGARLDAPQGADFTLQEVRTQLQLSDYSDVGEFYAGVDLLHDQIGATTGVDLEVREAWLKFTAFSDQLEVKAGRQALNWGTGDLIFANDLFAKDWNSFFVGREDPYLKVPIDALRLRLRGLPFGVDLVYTPRFTADVLPDQRRLAAVAADIAPLTNPIEVPGGLLSDGELGLRLTRRFGANTLALYAYRGFTGTPDAGRMEAGSMTPFHPELRAFGASARGALLGGVYWAESAFRDIPDNSAGADPLLPGRRTDLLLGYERSFGSAASWEIQYSGQFQMEDSLPAEDRHLLTLRLEKRAFDETIRLSLFAFHAPEDKDGHARPFVSYDHSDEVQLAMGANIFYGDGGTLFGDMADADNIYARLRYRF